VIYGKQQTWTTGPIGPSHLPKETQEQRNQKGLLEHGLLEQGVRHPLQNGVKRHEWKAAHGFRKFYKSRAEQVLSQ
jgi:hypothetical protein